MFIRTESLNLLQGFFEKSDLINQLNSYGLTLFHSFFFTAVAFFIYSTILSVLYQKKAELLRYGFTSILYCLLAQGPTFLVAQLRPETLTFHIEDLFAISPPYFVLLLYFLCAFVLKIDKTISVAISIKLYIILLINLVGYYLLENFFFFFFTNDPAYQMIIYLFANSIMLLANIILAVLLTHIIKKRQLWVNAYNFKRTSAINFGRALLRHTLFATLLYFVVVCLLKLVSYTGNLILEELVIIAVAIICVLSLVISYMLDTKAIDRGTIQNQGMHIHSLVDAIDNSRTLHHDMNNMMQAYQGYIDLENWDGLRDYHASLLKQTINADNFLRLSSNFHINPALLSLLIAKQKKAQERGVLIDIKLFTAAEDIEIEPLDLTRMVGILLDNAIEETAQADNKTIVFSLQAAQNGKILLSVSNPTVYDIDIKKINESGLYTLWKIIHKIPGCKLNIGYLDRVVTFYLEISCKDT